MFCSALRVAQLKKSQRSASEAIDGRVGDSVAQLGQINELRVANKSLQNENGAVGCCSDRSLCLGWLLTSSSAVMRI